MVRWADDQISEGRVPLDGWYPYLSLGSSFFHHYQSLPHTLTAYAAHVTGAGDQTTYLWILYLLLALWPISVYWGARLLGWSRWTAAAAAAVSPLVVSASGYGYEHGSYTWQGYGVYSQLWAMWLLPLAWGLTWRAVTRGTYYAAAALVLALTMACHFITGYLAVLTVGVWVLVCAGGYLRRAGRAAHRRRRLGADRRLGARPARRATRSGRRRASSTWARSSTTRTARRRCSAGCSRASCSTTAASRSSRCSFVVGRRRVRRRGRGATHGHGRCSARSLLSLLLFFGRPTLGPLLDLLPGFRRRPDPPLRDGRPPRRDPHRRRRARAGSSGRLTRARRRLVPVRTCGARGWRRPSRSSSSRRARARVDRARRLRPRTARRSSAASRRPTRPTGATSTSSSRSSKGRGDGRVYAGLRGNWGADVQVGAVPVHAWLADRDVDAIGFTFRTIASLSTDIEAHFDETNPAQYEMFNIRYLILPADRKPRRAGEAHGEQRPAPALGGARRAATSRSSTAPRRSTADRTNLAAATRPSCSRTSPRATSTPASRSPEARRRRRPSRARRRLPGRRDA